MGGRNKKARIANDLGGRHGDPGCEGARESAHENTTTRDASAQRREAELWRRRNPDAWQHFVNLAVNEAANERKFSMQFLMEDVRRKSFVDEIGLPSGINNTIRPALTRLLIEEHPEVEPYVETRRATCDRAFQEPL